MRKLAVKAAFVAASELQARTVLRMSALFLAGAALAMPGPFIAPARAAVTFGNASLGQGAFLQATDNFGAVFDSDAPNDQDTAAVPTDLNVAISGHAFTVRSDAKVSASGHASFSNGGASGTLDIVYDESAQATVGAASASASFLYEYFYDFSVDTSSKIFGTSDTDSGVVLVYVLGPPNYINFFTPGPGSFEVSLAPGSYRLGFSNDAGNQVSAFGPDGFSSTSGTDSFSFNILSSVVPEPASWSLMIAGFGMIGASLRRHAKKRGPATLWWEKELLRS